MNDYIKRKLDKTTIIKDIEERKNIIHIFETTGFLDRNDAIP